MNVKASGLEPYSTIKGYKMVQYIIKKKVISFPFCNMFWEI